MERRDFLIEAAALASPAELTGCGRGERDSNGMPFRVVRVPLSQPVLSARWI